MRSHTALVSVWCVLGSMLVFGQAGGEIPATTEMTAPGIPGVVAAGTKVKVLHTWEPGLGGEGPVAMPDGSVVFTQQNQRKIVRLDKDGKASVYLDTQPYQILALAYDLKGRLIGTQRGDPSGVAVLSPTRAIVADKFEGQRFGRPNDLVVDAKGGIYFTDNTGPRAGEPPPPPSAKPGVYYIAPDGQVRLASDAIAQPNGIQLSPDGKVLYVGMGSAQFVKAFDVQPDGRAINPRDFAQLSVPGTPGGADGMAMDAAGRLYVTANGGVKVFSAQGGQPLGVIPTAVKPSNVTFAGVDRRTLFIVSARGAAYTVAMQVEGVKGRAK